MTVYVYEQLGLQKARTINPSINTVGKIIEIIIRVAVLDLTPENIRIQIRPHFFGTSSVLFYIENQSILQYTSPVYP